MVWSRDAEEGVWTQAMKLVIGRSSASGVAALRLAKMPERIAVPIFPRYV